MADDNGKEFMETAGISLKGSIYIRDCYSDLYTDIKELFSLGSSYVHMSGNPGIGKSCFMWYVLKQLLGEAKPPPAVIVELNRGSPGNRVTLTYVFTPDGKCEKVTSFHDAKESSMADVWLLTDQMFVGSILREEYTVLFASPKEDNWMSVRKTMLERRFKTLYMPPWSIEELHKVYFKHQEPTKQSLLEFWMMHYLAGPIVRYYSMSFEEVYSDISMALTKIVSAGVVNATLFKGGVDNGQFSHKIFVFWPTFDYMLIKEISFLSEWVAECFAIACYRGDMKTWMESTATMASDPRLRTSAGILFERYAHHRLALGGEFFSIEDPGKSLVLERRKTIFFDGNSLQLPYIGYVRPNSSSFPYPPYIIFQISLALKRKAIKRSAYNALCASMKQFARDHPNLKSGLKGVEAMGEVWMVLVKMEGDNATQSRGLSLVEDEDAPPAAAPEACLQVRQGAVNRHGKRPRPETIVISKKKQDEKVNHKQKLKKTVIPFQMTVALKMDIDKSLEYTTLDEIQRLVLSRIDNEGVDTGFCQFGQMLREEQAGELATVVMRGGRGCIQYKEKTDGICTFGVWIEAVRCKKADEEETSITIKCTRGDLDGRSLTLFINERVGLNTRFLLPVMLKTGTSSAEGSVFDFAWQDKDALVVITSKKRTSRKIQLVF